MRVYEGDRSSVSNARKMAAYSELADSVQFAKIERASARDIKLAQHRDERAESDSQNRKGK